MSIVKYAGAPTTDIWGLFDRLHDDFWREPSFQLNRNWRPTDVDETESQYTIEIELPRFKREEIKVELTKGVIKITAKNSKSSYTREFSLPFVDSEKTEVSLENGVLRLVIPKNENGKTKYLTIK